MDVQQMLKEKTVTVQEAVSLVKSGNYIYTFGVSGEPVTFFSHFDQLRGKVKDLHIVDLLNPVKFPYFDDPSYEGMVINESLFFNRYQTALQKKGVVSFVPNHLGSGIQDRLYYHRLRHKPVDIVVLSVSPMDEHGYFSSGTLGMSVQEMVREGNTVILEVNEKQPRTFGHTEIHISEVDAVFPSEDEVVYLPPKEVSEIDMTIGHYVAELIEDGSTIQLGIGNIPTAVARSLMDKKDLGIHTEMMGEGLIDLCKAGVVTNRCKTLYPGKSVTAFSYASKEAYEYLDNNPSVLHLRVEEVNNPAMIAKNEKMISVNTCLQMDLMGQCSSEAFGTLQISGTGGQTETVRGAKESKGGKSIMAFHSTVNARQADGTRKQKSCIVPVQPEGTAISLLRADTDYVVTEYGIAALRGASLQERAKALIGIAHPDYREELREAAKKLYLI